MTDLIGHSLGRYHILEPLGEGGMAVVYKAYDTHLECDVAVKVIRIDHLGPAVLERALKRFEREARSVAKLTHPGIVQVVDYGEHEGSPYLVMPYLPGGTLKQYLRQHGKLTWQEAARMLLPIAEALGYAHQQNLVHRDVKPANILLTAAGRPMLTDFGVAKVLDEDVTQDLTGTAATVGTPEYMAPEQVMSKTVDHRADIYALGVVFFEMLIGRKPFEADTPMAVLVMHASAPLPRPKDMLPDLPDEVEKVLIKALQKKPEDRYQDMSEFVAALEKLLNNTKVSAPPIHSVEAILRPGIRAESSGTADQSEQAAIDDQVQENASALQPQPVLKRPIWVRFVLIGLAGVVLVTLLIIGFTNGWFTAKSAPVPGPVPTLQQPISTTFPPTTTDLPNKATDVLPTQIDSYTIGSTIVSTKDGMTMVYVPTGEFQMGSPDGTGEDDEHPQHTVHLDAYWIDQTEVTNAMFAKFVADANYRTDAETAGSSYALVGIEWLEVSGVDWQHPLGPSSTLTGLDDHPVIHVSWNDAYAYCDWAGKRLPTEAEWEKAARGTEGATYPWGNNDPTGELVNYADANTSFDWSVRSVNDGYKYTSPVGNYPEGASPYGALDMAGNVWEWVTDWYEKDYYSQSPERNPEGPASGTIRVMRGGAWDDLISGIRTAYRAAYIQTNTNGDTGFRCASTNELNP